MKDASSSTTSSRGLSEGMIRCYMCADKVIGFGHKLITALTRRAGRSGLAAAQPGQRIMNPVSRPAFQAAANKEIGWIQRCWRCGNRLARSLPIICDAGLLYGPTRPSGETPMCFAEINVRLRASVSRASAAEIARVVLARLLSAKKPTRQTLTPILKTVSRGIKTAYRHPRL